LAAVVGCGDERTYSKDEPAPSVVNAKIHGLCTYGALDMFDTLLRCDPAMAGQMVRLVSLDDDGNGPAGGECGRGAGLAYWSCLRNEYRERGCMEDVAITPSFDECWEGGNGHAYLNDLPSCRLTVDDLCAVVFDRDATEDVPQCTGLL
jgi:hypothetical protein